MKAVLDFVGAAGEYGEKRQDEYIRMFEDCSWEYLMNFGGRVHISENRQL